MLHVLQWASRAELLCVSLADRAPRVRIIIIFEIVRAATKKVMAAVFAFAAALVATVTAAPVASVAVDVEQIHIAQGGPAGEWPTPCGFTDMLLSRDTMVA